MSDSHDLTKLEPDTFEQMVNALALSAIGGLPRVRNIKAGSTPTVLHQRSTTPDTTPLA